MSSNDAYQPVVHGPNQLKGEAHVKCTDSDHSAHVSLSYHSSKQKCVPGKCFSYFCMKTCCATH